MAGRGRKKSKPTSSQMTPSDLKEPELGSGKRSL